MDPSVITYDVFSGNGGERERRDNLVRVRGILSFFSNASVCDEKTESVEEKKKKKRLRDI